MALERGVVFDINGKIETNHKEVWFYKCNNSASISGISPISQGQVITLTCNAVNCGTPTYQWKLNGTNVGTNSNTYSYTGNYGDIVQCYVTPSNDCQVVYGTYTGEIIKIIGNLTIPFGYTQPYTCSSTNVYSYRWLTFNNTNWQTAGSTTNQTVCIQRGNGACYDGSCYIPLTCITNEGGSDQCTITIYIKPLSSLPGPNQC